jgi:hypothetical protein
VSKPKVSTLGKNVQVLGHFNPRLFVPRWFADVGLLPEEEADGAENEFIHEEMAQFQVDWASINVTKERFIASTTRVGHIEPLRDLVVGTLELLTHTPTNALGINHDFWLDFADRSSFDAFGWALVPPANWPVLQRPGMVRTNVQGERKDGREGYLRIQVEPVLDGQFRVHVGVNDHYQVGSQPASSMTPTIVGIINARWFESISEADEIVEHMTTVGAS